LGFVMDHDLHVDLILTSLPKSFSQFLVNFHMNKIEVTLSELIAMLRTVEADFDSGRSKTHSLLLPSSKSAQGKGSTSSSSKGKAILMPVNTKGKGACFQCGKTGHWKKDCMFMIEINLALNSSSSWVLDTGCGTNLCNSLQGLRKVRKFRAGDLDLRLGNGSRIIAEAVGMCDVTLSNGYVLTLDPCYFISNVVRNIISVSYLCNLGLERNMGLSHLSEGDRLYYGLIILWTYEILGQG
ncbi:zf-CCHC domain-containing protein, partial [Cephalotus follicularis]